MSSIAAAIEAGFGVGSGFGRGLIGGFGTAHQIKNLGSLIKLREGQAAVQEELLKQERAFNEMLGGEETQAKADAFDQLASRLPLPGAPAQPSPPSLPQPAFSRTESPDLRAALFEASRRGVQTPSGSSLGLTGAGAFDPLGALGPTVLPERQPVGTFDRSEFLLRLLQAGGGSGLTEEELLAVLQRLSPPSVSGLESLLVQNPDVRSRLGLE